VAAFFKRLSGISFIFLVAMSAWEIQFLVGRFFKTGGFGVRHHPDYYWGFILSIGLVGLCALFTYFASKRQKSHATVTVPSS
jgi:hypothetical protein